jgi:Holliday junction resolvasome RuvABC endonuclease subunit|tara:strand:+ start:288 stop:803 length:516 start_codon:yes stop_codon:yes gene_type:complete
MILGLDVSTSRIGWAIVNGKQELVDSGFYKTNNKTSLEERATALRDNVLIPIMAIHDITEIRIEEPFSMFSGGKTTARTMSSLQRFNGMVSLIAHLLLGKPPTLVGATTARSRCGIKVPRGTKAKVVVLAWADDRFDNFIMEHTRHGNPKPGLDDEADAIVVALSHFDLRT